MAYQDKGVAMIIATNTNLIKSFDNKVTIPDTYAPRTFRITSRPGHTDLLFKKYLWRILSKNNSNFTLAKKYIEQPGYV